MNTTPDSLVHKKSGEDATQNENKINDRARNRRAGNMRYAAKYFPYSNKTPRLPTGVAIPDSHVSQ